jgi:hypothetical protein
MGISHNSVAMAGRGMMLPRRRAGGGPGDSRAMLGQMFGGGAMRDAGFGQGQSGPSTAHGSEMGQWAGQPGAGSAIQSAVGTQPHVPVVKKPGMVNIAGHDFTPEQATAFRQWTGAVAKANPKDRVHGKQPGWEEMVGWDTQRRNARLQFANGLAQNEQALAQAQNGYGAEDYRFNRGWDSQMEGINYADMRRGMGRSGVNDEHWGDYVSGRDMGLRDLLMGRQAGEDRIYGQRGDLERTLSSKLAGVNSCVAPSWLSCWVVGDGSETSK